MYFLNDANRKMLGHAYTKKRTNKNLIFEVTLTLERFSMHFLFIHILLF